MSHLRGQRLRILLGSAGMMLILFLISFSDCHSWPSIKTWTYPSGYDPHGGYIDRLTLKYDDRDFDEAILELQLGHVSSYGGQIPHQAIVDLDATPGVEVTSEPGIAFRQFNMQCQRFPTNMTGYRRALALALDKYRVVENARGGFAQIMDNPISPLYSFWSFENQIPFHYYAEDISGANATLDAAQIIDTWDSPHPGWRYYDADQSGSWTAGDLRGDIQAPDGLKIDLYASVDSESGIEATCVLAECMEKCGLQGESVIVDYNALIAALSEPWAWNLASFAFNIEPPGDPEFLYDFFHVESVDNGFFYRFNNSEYNYNCTQFMTATTKIEARNWAWNCCRILMEEMPLIVCYCIENTRAYRTDIWGGYVNQLGRNCIGDNPYTFEQIHLSEEMGGPFGCFPTEYISTSTEPLRTTNLIRYPSGRPHIVFDLIYSRLRQIDPLDQQFNYAPDLSWNWTREPTVASGDIQSGMKYTFHLFENISWHDGTPFSSEDVRYTVMNINRKLRYEVPNTASVYRVDTPNNSTVVLYSNSTAYMGWTKVPEFTIFPKHIWSLYAPNFTWTPVTPIDMSGTGCFKWVTHSFPYIFLDRYENWHFTIEHPPRILCPPPTPILWFYAILTIGTIVVIIQIVVLSVLLRRRRKSQAKKESATK